MLSLVFSARCRAVLVPTFRRGRAIGFGLLWMVALLPGAGVARGEEAPPSRFRIGFAPVEGEVWIKSVTDERLRDMRGVAPDNEQITRTTTEQVYHRRDDGHWEVTETVRDAHMQINGADVDNPALKVAVGHPLHVRFDEEGRAVAVAGFDALMERYERELPPEFFARLRSRMSPESMERRELESWNAPFEGVRGETVELGERWGVLDETVFQGNPVPLRGVLHFEAWTEIDGVAGVKMVLDYDIHGEAYQRWEGEMARVISRRPEGRQYGPSNLELSGQTTWVIDPQRGQVLYEVHEQTTQVPLGDIDGPKAKLVERHTWRYRREG